MPDTCEIGMSKIRIKYDQIKRENMNEISHYLCRKNKRGLFAKRN